MKVSLTIHCKYKYFDSTVQRAEDRQQMFYFCRLPFAVNVKLNLSNEAISLHLVNRQPCNSWFNISYFSHNLRALIAILTSAK